MAGTTTNSASNIQPLPPIQLPSVAEAIAARSLPKAGPDLMLALDIDGTTLRHDASLSPRVKELVHAHLAAGTQLFFATGRGIAGTQRALNDLDIERGFVVVCNGAMTVTIGDTLDRNETTALPIFYNHNEPEYRLVQAHTFNPQPELDLLTAGLPKDVWYAVETLNEPTRVSYPFPEKELFGPTKVVPISELASDRATRLTVRAGNMTAHELLTAVADLGLVGVEYAVGWSAWMDISPEGVSKASALEELRIRLGIDPAHTVSVGDSGNDVSMLSWANLGVAMGNAPEYVQAQADAITGHVDDDGCADVLAAFF